MQNLSTLLFGGAVSSDVVFYVIVALSAVVFLFFMALILNVLAVRVMMKGLSSHPRRFPDYHRPVQQESREGEQQQKDTLTSKAAQSLIR